MATKKPPPPPSGKLNYGFGALNPQRLPDVFSTYDPETTTGIGTLRNVCQNQYTENTLVRPPSTFKAICLRVEVSSLSGVAPAGSWLNSVFSFFQSVGGNEVPPTQLLAVKARIPEIHACLPDPFADSSAQVDQKIIDMYPTFIAVDAKSVEDSPVPGDIIVVDFKDKINWKSPVYLGKVFSSPIGPQGGGSSKGAFAGTRSRPMFSYAVAGPPPGTPTAGTCEETKGWGDNCAWAGGKPLGEIKLVDIGTGGHKLSADAAEAWREMATAASNGGYTLKPSGGSAAAFRTMREQAQKWAQYQTGGNQAAQPGFSKHQSGLAIDIANTNNRTPQGRRDGTTDLYKWLAHNAHKYGFIRRVASESWHWVYVGEADAKNLRVAKSRIYGPLGRDLAV